MIQHRIRAENISRAAISKMCELVESAGGIVERRHEFDLGDDRFDCEIYVSMTDQARETIQARMLLIGCTAFE
jgi:hypothetical protein